jgi:hypothetical protein
MEIAAHFPSIEDFAFAKVANFAWACWKLDHLGE